MQNVQNAIISLLMDRLQRKFDGQNTSCSQHLKCSNCSYDGTDLYVSWAVASRVCNTCAANRPAESQYGPRGRLLSGPLAPHTLPLAPTVPSPYPPYHPTLLFLSSLPYHTPTVPSPSLLLLHSPPFP